MRQNCLGLESPAILRVRSRNRTPSPPAKSTAQRCEAEESGFCLRCTSTLLFIDSLHDAHRTEECDGLGDFVLISEPDHPSFSVAKNV